MEQMQQLLEQCLADTLTNRTKLYGLALMRTIDRPQRVARALGKGKSRQSYNQAFHPIYQAYGYVFTDTPHQYFHPDVRDFLRRYLFDQRQKREISATIARIHNNQQQRLVGLE